MKKILLALMLTSFWAYSQNWQPVVSSNVYNYFSSTSFSTACIIKTDSAKVIGGDSLLILTE